MAWLVGVGEHSNIRYHATYENSADLKSCTSRMFALEGTLTGLIGIVSYFYLPPSPTQTASRFRGKDGWFNEREEKIMVNRILRDDPSKGDMRVLCGLALFLQMLI